MNEHVIESLSAYHDGELSSARRQQVEKHLQDCPACRTELEKLASLSALLQAEPLPAQTPAQRFAAQVQLRLPHSVSPQRTGPRWVLGTPLALVLIWAFLQAALWVTSAVLATGLALDGSFAWSGAGDLAESLGTLFLLNIALLTGAAILWAGWMAFWWTWKQNQTL
jgi:anti-sigma factor RsiW